MRRAFHVGRGAVLNLHLAHLSEAKSKTIIDLMVGEGASVNLSGFYDLKAKAHLDIETNQHHIGPNSISRLLLKGVLSDSSRAVFQGLIKIDSTGDGSDAYLENRNLLLSTNCRADSIPSLEILSEDVRCSHGASVSSQDEEELFYLMSKGITRFDAESIITDGFLRTVKEPFTKYLGGELDARR